MYRVVNAEFYAVIRAKQIADNGKFLRINTNFKIFILP